MGCVRKLAKGGGVMIWIGIDPGQTGSMAVISEQTMVWDFEDGECVRMLGAIADQSISALASDYPQVRAVLEKVHSMPKQGVVSSFKFGMNFGIWQGRLEMCGIPYDFATPQKWQKVIFDSMTKGDRKAMSLDRARRLFPDLRDRLKRKKDHNRAEALLIAEYCRRTDNG